MGSKWIWIAASVAFGLLSGMIYTFFKRHDGKMMLRFGISAAAYTVWGLVLCRIIWVLFAG